MKSLLTDVSCTLLPGKYNDGRKVPGIYNEAYRFWRATWGEIFLKAGSPGSLNTENFMRQDAFILLHIENRIIGMMGNSFFNLSAEAIYDHAYLHPFPKNLIEELKRQGHGFVTTAEYLAVHPEFRKSIVGVSLSEVLIGIGLKIVSECQAMMTLATTVKPAKVYESGQKFGWTQVGTVQKYGLDCQLLINTPEQLHDHEDSEIASLVDAYWEKRSDLTGLTVRKEKITLMPERKKAA